MMRALLLHYDARGEDIDAMNALLCAVPRRTHDALLPR